MSVGLKFIPWRPQSLVVCATLFALSCATNAPPATLPTNLPTNLPASSTPIVPQAAPPASKNSPALFAHWKKVSAPTPGPAEPIGAYAAGCLQGASTVPSDGKGYALMRPSRHRRYAHPDMIQYLGQLGARLAEQKMPLLLVGDVGPARGGPMNNGHNSHQTGLDVDLWLRMSQKRPSRSQRESWTAPHFVHHRKTLSRSWSATQIQLIAAAADFESVNRIFVSPAIKQYFCEHQPKAPWLYRLRAWWGHEEHIHVRLNCPPDAKQCISQAPLEQKDNGCGKDLQWWFSAEADEEWKKLANDKSPRVFPDLPASCQDVLLIK